MPFDKSKINKILVISLSNIGDVILTLPVIDILLRDFPQAKLSVVIGPKANTLLKGNPRITTVHVFNKNQAVLRTISWVASLGCERFDLVADLRNTAIPLLIFPRHRTSLRTQNHENTHMKYKHLQRLRGVYPYETESQNRYALAIRLEDEAYIEKMLHGAWGGTHPYIIVAPGAASEAKRWSSEGFIEVCRQLNKRYQIKVVFVGDGSDHAVAARMTEALGNDAVNLCGRTDLVQLAAVTQKALLALVNDSAPMHMASYLDVPVLALFGPSDACKYGPWGHRGHYLQKNNDCPACQNPKGQFRHNCMAAITAPDVLDAFEIVGKQVVFSKT